MNDMVIGYHPNGKQAFSSCNLRGLIDYGRKHGIAQVTMGDIKDGGSFTATFGNGVVCKSTFADPGIMLGFFLGRSFVDEIVCERTTFNHGTRFGRIRIPFLCPLPKYEAARFGPWLTTPYRDEHSTALVKFTRG